MKNKMYALGVVFAFSSCLMQAMDTDNSVSLRFEEKCGKTVTRLTATVVSTGDGSCSCDVRLERGSEPPAVVSWFTSALSPRIKESHPASQPHREAVIRALLGHVRGSFNRGEITDHGYNQDAFVGAGCQVLQDVQRDANRRPFVVYGFGENLLEAGSTAE